MFKYLYSQEANNFGTLLSGIGMMVVAASSIITYYNTPQQKNEPAHSESVIVYVMPDTNLQDSHMPLSNLDDKTGQTFFEQTQSNQVVSDSYYKDLDRLKEKLALVKRSANIVNKHPDAVEACTRYVAQ